VGSTPSQIQLIINADDFGIARGVNIGIIEAAKAGVVTSTSLIVNLPAFADAIARAQSCPDLSLGLHLNFTIGRPLTAAPSLARADTGEFHSLPTLLGRASLGLVDTADIDLECKAQIDRMIDAGLRLTHLDSHRHVHAHPAISTAVVRAAASRGISHVRIPCEPLGINPGDWRATLKKVGLLISVRLSRRGTANQAPRFFGISLQGAKSFASRLFALIARLPPGTNELMTHPGYTDATLTGFDSYALERENELAVLCTREFRELLDRCGITLTSFGKLQPIPPAVNQIAQHR
jgi:chitin disaccharide deacetylase